MATIFLHNYAGSVDELTSKHLTCCQKARNLILNNTYSLYELDVVGYPWVNAEIGELTSSEETDNR